MEKINTIVKSNIPPRDTNAVWLNTEDGSINVFDPQEGWKATAGGAGGMQEIKYEDLVSLRDAGKLVPGQQYRITDYVTKTGAVNSYVVSDEHPFDLIVTADSASTINENAKAINPTPESIVSIKYVETKYTNGMFIGLNVYQRMPEWDSTDHHGEKVYAWANVGSTIQDANWILDEHIEPIGAMYTPKEDYEAGERFLFEDVVSTGSLDIPTPADYFSSCNLHAWQIKYCLDNDTNRFDWALTARREVTKAIIEVAWGEYDSRGSRLAGYYFWYIKKDHGTWYIVHSDWAGINPDTSSAKLSNLTEEEWNVETSGLDTFSGLSDLQILMSIQKMVTYPSHERNCPLSYQSVAGEMEVIDYPSGKGVIYYMQDEYGNEAHFDFKNIKIDSGYVQEEFEPTEEYYHLFTDGTESGDTSLNGASHINRIIDGSQSSILKPSTLSDVWETIYNSENYALIGYNATAQAQIKDLSEALSALTDRVVALEQAANP